MAKKTYTWMPTKQGGSKAKYTPHGRTAQGWRVKPLIVGGEHYFQLEHCVGNPDYVSSDRWVTMTRLLSMKPNTKRTAMPMNPRIGQGCGVGINDAQNAAEWHSMKELLFDSVEDAQTFAEETRQFSLTTICC